MTVKQCPRCGRVYGGPVVPFRWCPWCRLGGLDVVLGVGNVKVTMPGKVYNACFDPLATGVPHESGWPDATPSRVGFGYQYTYDVTPEQLADMLDHAYTWGSGLAFGTDDYTQAEARAVLRWVAKCRGETP